MFHKMSSARLTIFPGLRHGSTYKSAQNKCIFPGGLLTFSVYHITSLKPAEASLKAQDREETNFDEVRGGTRQEDSQKEEIGSIGWE